MVIDSDSLKSLEHLTENSPEELVKALKALGSEFRLIAIVPYGARHVAYLVKNDTLTATKPTNKKKGV